MSDASADVAEGLNAGFRVLQGELPYRDFWLLYPPGEAYLPALLYRLVGLRPDFVLLVQVILGALGGAAAFWLAQSLLRRTWLALLVALVVYFQGSVSVFFLLLMLAATLLLHHFRVHSPRAVALAGLLTGVAFFFDTYVTGAGLTAFLVALLLHGQFQRRTWRQALALPALCGGCALLVAVLMALPLLPVWKPMLLQLFHESLQHGTIMTLPYFFSSFASWELLLKDLAQFHGLASLPRLLYDFGWWLTVVAQYLLPGLGLLAAVGYLGTARPAIFSRTVTWLLLLWAVFGMPRGLFRSDLGHLTQSTTPLFFLLGFLLERASGASGFGRQALRGLLVATGLLVALSVPLSLVRATREWWTPHYAVRAPRGVLLLADASEAGHLQATIDFITSQTQEDDYIFVTPWFAPPLYALTNRRNPTYYDSLVDPIILPSVEKQQGICRDLLAKGTRVVVHYPYWGFDDKPHQQFLAACPLVQECLDRHFRCVAAHGRYWLYVPREH